MKQENTDYKIDDLTKKPPEEVVEPISEETLNLEAKMRAKRNTVKGIIQRLNEEADTARRYLDICELEVLEPRYTDDFVLKLLYELINKGTSLRVKLPEGVFDMTTEVHGVYGE